MMKIAFKAFTQKDDLYPFTLTRDVFDIRLGILTLREKWELLKNHGAEIITDLIRGKKNKDASLYAFNR